MATLSQEYLDQKLQLQTEAILAVVNQRFDETLQRLDVVEVTLASLISRVARTIKAVQL